jgi:pimeloyl-ACP methyl ester carboxylesterase
VDTVYNLTRSGGAFPLSPHRVNDLHREQVETTAMESGEKQHHFVLVHGVCHGAWCWYKVATILESAGHRVTALDMTACGASAACIEEVRSFEEYSRPLLDAVAALTPGEKAVLVGHSFGGQSLALAMERYPDKVAVAVFVSAAMPAAGKPMAFVLEQVRRTRPWWGLLDRRPCVFRWTSPGKP